MLNLYILLTIMMILALSIIIFPFIKNQAALSKNCIIVSGITIITSSFLYLFSGNKSELKQWFIQGKTHYELQEQVNNLGGIDGMINRIQKKLEINPQDAEGWFILGKLYYIKHDYKSAKFVLKKALDLNPDSAEIATYYKNIN